MKEQLEHILDQSVCLTRRQLKDYLSGGMLPIEAHAVEHHLASCPLCSMAMEGFEEHSDEALQAIASLNSGFLKEHFDNIAPQIHLNSMVAPTVAATAARARKGFSMPFPVKRVAGIAAVLLVALGIYWYVGSRQQTVHSIIAMKDAVPDQNTATASAATAALPSSGKNTDASNNTAVLQQVADSVEHNAVASPKTSPKPAQSFAAATAPAHPVAETAGNDSSSIASKAPSFTSNAFQEKRARVRSELLNRDDDRSADADDTREGVTGGGAQLSSPSSGSPVRLLSKSEKKASGEEAGTANLVAAKPSATRAYRSPIITPEKTKEEETAPLQSPVDLGNAAFAKGAYKTALRYFQKAMQKGDKIDRQRATILAAKCYAALGNKEKAEELLRDVREHSSGAKRRAAKRELRKLK